MNLEILLSELETYRNTFTEQTRTQVPFYYKNKYLNVIKYTSSNKAIQYGSKNSKQWNIIYLPKKDFKNLDTWIKFTAQCRINITKFRSHKQDNLLGIRIYDMSREPNNDIIQKILTYIFSE